MERNHRSLKLGRTLRNAGRLAAIVQVFARQGFWSVFERLGLSSWLTPEQFKKAEEISKEKPSLLHGDGQEETFSTTRAASRLRHALEQLGPAFVKLGQMLASRPDLLPAVYLSELSKLHQDVAKVPFEEIRKILEAELGPKLRTAFLEISPLPIAAGSMGQVHKAKLQDGREVAIKVQRPGIAELVETDCHLIEFLAHSIENYIPDLGALKPATIAEEFCSGIRSELDFTREAGNTSKIRKNFADTDSVVIPEVVWELSTAKVLVMTFLDGLSINEKKKFIDHQISSDKLVENGLNAFLKMVFKDGLYHGDLHAGNLLALAGNRVGILDFGLCIKVGPSTRQSMAALLVALVREDYEALVRHFLDLTSPPADFDATRFEDEVASALSPYVGLDLGRIPTGQLLWKLAGVASKHGAPMPRSLVAFFKTIGSFEGVGRTLDPEFDVISACRKFSTVLVDEMYSPEALKKQAIRVASDLATLTKHAPVQIRSLLKLANDGHLQLQVGSKDLLSAAKALDRLASRLAVSVIVAALVIGSSILVLAKVGAEFYNLSFFGLIGYVLAGILGLYVVFSIIRGSGGRL